MAFGTWGFQSDWIRAIPIFNLLRVPARSLFLTGISMAVISGKTLDHISCDSENNALQKKAYFGVVALGIMMIIGLVYLSHAKPIMIIWGFACFVLGGLLLLVYPGGSGRKTLEWLLVGLLIVDLLGASLTAYEIQRKGLRKPAEALSTLINEEGYFRIYSPSYSVDQYLAAEYDLELADGVDPLQIASYVAFMEKATGVPQDQYSVTIPPFKNGKPSQDNINAIINSTDLGLLNVKYVVSDFEISTPGLTPQSTDGIPKIYLNEQFLPRAWVERAESDQSLYDPANLGQAQVLSKSANEIRVKALGPGKLVLSEIQYPGWRVYVDGKRQELTVSHEVLRSVSLTEGSHQILFKFIPISVYIGLALAGIGWVILAFNLIGKRVEKVSS